MFNSEKKMKLHTDVWSSCWEDEDPSGWTHWLSWTDQKELVTALSSRSTWNHTFSSTAGRVGYDRTCMVQCSVLTKVYNSAVFSIFAVPGNAHRYLVLEHPLTPSLILFQYVIFFPPPWGHLPGCELVFCFWAFSFLNFGTMRKTVLLLFLLVQSIGGSCSNHGEKKSHGLRSYGKRRKPHFITRYKIKMVS